MSRTARYFVALSLLLAGSAAPSAWASGTVAGRVTAGCPSLVTPLLGVTVDAFQVGTGDLIGSGTTDANGYYSIPGLAAGAYTITILTPLGYITASPDIPASVTDGNSSLADFALSCVATTGSPQASGFWKHQIGIATGGNGNPQVSASTLCGYLDAIREHFNQNALNQVVVFSAPASATCAQKLGVAKPLINAQSQTVEFVAMWGSLGSGLGQFARPSGVATDANGNVFVADTDNNRVQRFTSAGVWDGGWGFQGSGPGAFFHPYQLATDVAGNVYVTDSGYHRVEKFTNTGSYLTEWGSFGSGNGQFYAPFGVTVDATGNVFVADQLNHRIQEFSDTGSFIAKWGSFGGGNGQFNYPLGVATDGAGNVFVADWLNDRIQKFDGSGAFLTAWGTTGSGNGQFIQPFCVATDVSGNVYVTESQNRVQMFTNSGTYITQWGTSGTGNGEFNTPTGIAVDAAGSIYVADQGNHRMQKFALGGASTPTDRARQQLLSILLNVAANYLGLDDVISKDGATVSQAITYCDGLIDSPTGDKSLAISIGDKINSGQKVNAGVIPLSTQQIAYRRSLALRTFRVTPNPGHGARQFQFSLGAESHVRLNVFDVSGRLVTQLVDGRLSEGPHSVAWGRTNDAGAKVGNGIYFARLETPGGARTLKVLQLIR